MRPTRRDSSRGYGLMKYLELALYATACFAVRRSGVDVIKTFIFGWRLSADGKTPDLIDYNSCRRNVLKIPSPKEVFEERETAAANEIIAYLSEKLNDKHWVRMALCGNSSDPYFRIGIPGRVNEADKKKIILELTAAGWYRIEVKNSDEFSEDREERPGLIGVTFYKNPSNSLLMDQIQRFQLGQLK